MDGRHVLGHARLPDQRRLPRAADQEHRGPHHAPDRHAGRIPLLRHGLDVAHAARLRRRSVGGHRPGARLRTLDLLPAHHRRGPRHQDVGAGLRSADDGRRLDDPARKPLGRSGRHGPRRIARDRRQPPADHLLLPAGDGRLLDQRGHRRPARKAPEGVSAAHGRAGRRGTAGRGVELRALWYTARHAKETIRGGSELAATAETQNPESSDRGLDLDYARRGATAARRR